MSFHRLCRRAPFSPGPSPAPGLWNGSGRFAVDLSRLQSAVLAVGRLTLIATLVACPTVVVSRQAVAQNQKRPAADDPFAEELNPFPKPEAEPPRNDPKPRSEKRPRTTGKQTPDDRSDAGTDDAPQLPMPFPETTVPGEPALRRPPKGEGRAGGGRPTARPMSPNVDLLPFPDVDPMPSDDDSPARNLLVKAEKLDRKGKYEEAKKVVLEAIEKDPKLPVARLALGIVCRHLNDFEGSVSACSAGLRLDDTDPELYLRRGIAWFHLGRHGIALEDFEDAAGIAYDDPRPELWRGLTLMELDKPLEAISAYSAAIRRDRTYDFAYLNRGLAYLATDEPGKAEVDFDQAIRHDPRHVKAWFNRGVAQARQAEYANAADSYQAALRIDPKHEGARRNLEAIRNRQGMGGRSARLPPFGRRDLPGELVPIGRPVTKPAAG